MTTHLYLVPNMRMNGAMSHFFHTVRGVPSAQRWLQSGGRPLGPIGGSMELGPLVCDVCDFKVSEGM